MKTNWLRALLRVWVMVCVGVGVAVNASALHYDNDGTVTLQWPANTEPDLAGYNVYRATQPGGPYTKLNPTLLTATAFADAATVDGTTYYYVVTAVDQVDNESTYSPESEGCLVDMTAPTVWASPAGAHFFQAQTVALLASEQASIHYTTDGTTPTASSQQYSSALSISEDTVLTFIAIDLAGNSSTVETEQYTFPQPDDDSDGDGMPDLYEVEHGFDPQDDSDALEDADGDGHSNLAEYEQGTDPNDENSYPTPPTVAGNLLRPHAGQGLTAGTLRVPADTSVMVALDDEEGVDPATITLTVNGGVVAHTVHEMLTPGDMRQVWIVYDSLGSFGYDEQVNVVVEASDVNGYSMTPYAYSFKTETSAEHNEAQAAAPTTTVEIDVPSAGLTTINGEAGTELDGLEIVYANDEAVPPRLGPSDEIDPMADPNTMDVLLNIEPVSYYETPVTVTAPVSAAYDISSVSIYCYNPTDGWVEAVEGDGWLVSGSRVEHVDGGVKLLEFQITYAAPVQFLDESPPRPEYTLTANVVGSGSVAQDPAAPYYAEDVVTLTATPDAGWSFAGWSGDLSGTTNPTSITMDADKIVTAAFTQDEYTLTVNVVGGGSVGQDPANPYHLNDVVTLTAVPDAGWSFAGWSGDLSGGVNPASVTMDSEKTVTATFTQDLYTLTVNVVGSGSVGQDPAGPYHLNDVVTLTATPDAGWNFAGWSGDLTGTTNPASVTMTGNKTVTATFTEDDYTLTVNVVGSGSVDQSPAAPYHLNDVVTLTAVPDAGWSFAGWSGDLSGTTNPTSVTMDSHKSVTATFTQDEYTLTVNVIGSGSVDQSPAAPYHLNDVVMMTAMPDTDWSFAGWSGDLSGSTNPASITITGDRTVTATFTEDDQTPPTDPVISTAAQVINADVFAVELSAPSTDSNFSNYQVLGGQYTEWTNTAETGPFVFTLVQNAANTLSVRGRDTFDNVSNPASVVVTEDSVLPTTPVIATADQVIDADSIVVTLASPSTDDHFSNYQLRGGQYNGWTDVAETDNFQFALTEGAGHTLRIRGRDEAGNVSAVASIIVTEDSTAPTAPVIATQAQTVNADSITVTLASPSADDNLAGYQLLGAQYSVWTDTAETDNFAFSLVQNAENVLQVRGRDTAGHVSAAGSVVITEDSVLPTTPVIATADQVIDSDSIVVTLASPSTDDRFANYQLQGGQYIDWTDVAETDNFQFTLTQDVENTLQVRGKDEAANVGAAASILVTEDSTAPTAPVIATEAQGVNADSITVTLASPCTDTNFAGYQLRGGHYSDWTDTAETDNFVFNLVQNAQNVLEIRGIDAVGHVSAADSVTITEDSIAPAAPGQPVFGG